MPKGKRYPLEFKQEAVKLCQFGDRTIVQVARDLGINDKTLSNWVSKSMKKSDKDQTKNERSYQELLEENAKLKRELMRAQQERDILKKATAYFASQEK